MSAPLVVTREQILDYRRHVAGLDERRLLESATVREAAWAGLQDSVPKSALLSLTARLQGVDADTWTAPELQQVWGPRYTTYVIASCDRAIFTLGRHPLETRTQKRATQLADQLETFLSGRTLTYREAGQAIGVHPSALRYAATTGRVLIRWEGSGPPLVWTVPQPEMSPEDARKELLRRHLRILGPERLNPSPPGRGSRLARLPSPSTTFTMSWSRSVLRWEKHGSLLPTRMICAPRVHILLRLDCCPVVTAISCCGLRTAVSWFPTRLCEDVSGLRESGRALCSWTGRSSAPGAAAGTP